MYPLLSIAGRDCLRSRALGRAFVDAFMYTRTLLQDTIGRAGNDLNRILARWWSFPDTSTRYKRGPVGTEFGNDPET